MALTVSEKVHIVLPDNVRRVIGILESHGFEAYAVGGCVRDSVLGREPGDWDITTSALPWEIKRCFRRTVDTGIAHGTVTVLIGGGAYEVTTYRVDGSYRDHRHPDQVTYSRLIEEDLKRRDFTINAMAYNESHGIIDLHGGISDLKNRIIRCVGDPDERFDEDALRLLRAVRFAAQLDFGIESKTAQALKRHASELSMVSKERILVELTKLIGSAHIERTRDIFELGMAGYIAGNFDELNIEQLFELKFGTNRREDNFTETKNTYYNSNIENAQGRGYIIRGSGAFDLYEKADIGKRYIRFAFLGEGMAPGRLYSLLRSLKADNRTIRNAGILLSGLMVPLPADRYALKKYISGFGSRELFEELLELKAASWHTALYREIRETEELDRVVGIYSDITAAGEPIYLAELAVSGRDLIEAGAAEGPEIGRVLRSMLDDVHREPWHNNFSYLTGTYLRTLRQSSDKTVHSGE